MGWLQKVVSYPGDIDEVETPFQRLFEDLAKPSDHALFTRTSIDQNSEIYLLTPAAATLADRLGVGWAEAEDPTQFGWGLIAGPADALTRFGLSETDTIKAVNPSQV